MLIKLPNAFGDACTNMAIDSALLRTLPPGIAVFRHYGWSEPAMTFGYTQTFDAVQRAVESQLTLCRRSTGGGIVDHRNDWTYSLVIQNELPAAQIPATACYQKLHQCIQLTLAAQSVESQLAACPRKCGTASNVKKSTADHCFISHAANDVMLANGHKIAGAAMKRNRAGLLIQGSIQRNTLPLEFNFNTFSHDLVQAIATSLEIPIGHSDDLRALFDRQEIAQQRSQFSSREWNRKR